MLVSSSKIINLKRSPLFKPLPNLPSLDPSFLTLRIFSLLPSILQMSPFESYLLAYLTKKIAITAKSIFGILVPIIGCRSLLMEKLVENCKKKTYSALRATPAMILNQFPPRIFFEPSAAPITTKIKTETADEARRYCSTR